ncbi:DUF1648 domain-containing protein [Marinicrinis sediminis]|uniref:DUF1648 domain-containing protein n=1 Tax=Marinicrinis sediminis TaxID=1652465 RepID=A0ABW5RF04_9BACL
MAFTMLFMAILFISAVQIFIPFIVKRSVVFGVTVPNEQTKHPRLQSYKKQYAALTFVVGLAVTLGYVIWNQNGTDETKLVLSGVLAIFTVLLTSLSLYFYFHYQTMKRKKAEEWFRDVKQVHVTDLALRVKDEMLPSWIHLIPGIVTVILVVLSIRLYDQLPGQIPIHWGADGQPDAFTDKNWMSVIRLPLVLLTVQMMFLIINLFTKRSGIKINAANLTSSRLRQLRLRKYTSWFLMIINVLITMLFSFLQLHLLYENMFHDQFLVFMPIAFFLLILAGVLVLAIRVGKVDSDIEGALVTEQANKQERVDDDSYWKGGLLYFNPNDPSIFVEKRFGIGYTINFAQPMSYVILLVPVALILVILFTL